MAMQVAVSSSARSGSPAAIPAHRLDITRSTMAFASVRPPPVDAVSADALLADALLADAWPADAWLAGLPRRGLVFLLTASSYGSLPDRSGGRTPSARKCQRPLPRVPRIQRDVRPRWLEAAEARLHRDLVANVFGRPLRLEQERVSFAAIKQAIAGF
jgi:hypothetical protein